MKITSIETLPVLVPRWPTDPKPAPFFDIPVVVVRVRTDAGVEGIGHTMTLTPQMFRTLVAAVEELGEILVGEDPRQPERLLAKMLFPPAPGNWFGPGGVLNIAAAALDIAIWDIIGKVAGLPLWQLLGGYSNSVEVYDSWGTVTLALGHAAESARRSAEMGYRAMKVRPGPERSGPTAAIVESLSAIRDAVGPNVKLMMDVNQFWTPSRAQQVGRAIEHLDLAWIEDPTDMNDFAGQAQVAAALATPICAGEYHYGLEPLLRLIQTRAADILMVDLMRVGGITQFRKAAALADACGVPVVSHLLPEVFASLIAAVPNGLIVEGMPWTQGLFTGLPDLVDGRLVLSDRPGHGLALDESFLKAHSA